MAAAEARWSYGKLAAEGCEGFKAWRSRSVGFVAEAAEPMCRTCRATSNQLPSGRGLAWKVWLWINSLRFTGRLRGKKTTALCVGRNNVAAVRRGKDMSPHGEAPSRIPECPWQP